MQAARGAIAQELDDASLTSSDSQAIVKLISKTVMGSRNTSNTGAIVIDPRLVKDAVLSNQMCVELAGDCMSVVPDPAEFSEKYLNAAVSLMQDCADAVLAGGAAGLLDLADAIRDAVVQSKEKTTDSGEALEHRSVTATRDAAEDRFIAEIRAQDMLMRKIIALAEQIEKEADPGKAHKLESYVTATELKLHQNVSDAKVKGTGKAELKVTEAEIKKMGAEKWGRKVLDFLCDHPRMHAIVPFWRFTQSSWDFSTQAYDRPPRLNQDGAERLGEIEYPTTSGVANLSPNFVLAYGDACKFCEEKLKEQLNPALYARLARSECFGVEKVEEAPVLRDGMHKLWRTLHIARDPDPQQHTNCNNALREAAEAFEEGSLSSACTKADEALNMAKDLDMKVQWHSFGRCIRETLLDREYVSSQFIAAGGQSFTDLQAFGAEGGYHDSAAFTRGMLAKIATIKEPKDVKKVRKALHRQESTNKGNIDMKRTRCMAPGCSGQVTKSAAGYPLKLCDKCHRKGNTDGVEQITLVDGTFFKFNRRKGTEDATEGGIAKMRKKRKVADDEKKAKREAKRMKKKAQRAEVMAAGKAALAEAAKEKENVPEETENTDEEKMFVRLLKKYNLSSGEEAKPEKAGRAHAFRNLHEELEEFANEEAGVY